MKRYLYFILAGALMMMSCSDNDYVEKAVYKAKDVEGMWFCQENATFLSVYNTSFQGSVISIQEDIPTIVENLTGTWSYYPSNNILRMRFEYEKSKAIATRDYKLVKVDGNSLTLIDLDFNTLYTYYRVAEYYNLAIGDNFKMNTGSLVPSFYSVLNADIAEVDNMGNVVAHTAGTTFVSASSGTEIVYTRLDVDRIPCYQKSLFSTIDSVFDKYGKPDHSLFYDKNSISNMIAEYSTESKVKDKGLREIDFFYDDKTREITFIRTYYKSGVSFAEDISYTKEHYFDVIKEENNTTYGLSPGMSKNDFYIIVADGLLLYSNQEYLRNNKHY